MAIQHMSQYTGPLLRYLTKTPTCSLTKILDKTIKLKKILNGIRL